VECCKATAKRRGSWPNYNTVYWRWVVHGSALWFQWIRNKQECDKKHHEFHIDRDFANSTTPNTKLLEMTRINIENLMRYSMRISDPYYKATANDFWKITWKQIHYYQLRRRYRSTKKQVIELEEKGKDYEYIIKSKLQTKDCIVSIHHVQCIHYKGNYLYQLDKFLQKKLS
jgi:hypothetical protein